MKNKIDPKKEAKLLKEVTEVYNKSVILRNDAEFNYKLINKNNKLTPSQIENLSREEKEKLIKDNNIILSRFRISTEELKKLDTEYERLRKEVNKLYGKEVLPKSN
jgi:uncharacterized protein YllA (UPF0747 family)